MENKEEKRKDRTYGLYVVLRAVVMALICLAKPFKIVNRERIPAGPAVYFVDCGDHNPSTLSSGDSLGTNNSLTDMIYGEDPVTKMMWGAVDPKNSYISTGGGNRTKSKGAYTAWTWANENSPGEIADGQPEFKHKIALFRDELSYAKGGDVPLCEEPGQRGNHPEAG